MPPRKAVEDRETVRHSPRFGESVVTVGTSLPASIVEALDAVADSRYLSRSAVVREAIVAYFKAQGAEL